MDNDDILMKLEPNVINAIVSMVAVAEVVAFHSALSSIKHDFSKNKAVHRDSPEYSHHRCYVGTGLAEPHGRRFRTLYSPQN